ncbi:DUF2851 family protein [Reichenbachiella sp. MSK19-1]|uniref:DUF2851 family protein n=1 Tax=Reichenbachiella sp. MSK19-1 TaxID=1897631 RepID=UPI0013148E90|nr:DUF2851 family protein [Reichenbachiella sp. MSK19-1]
MVAAVWEATRDTVQETFLHFVWNYQRFASAHLVTVEDQPIEIYNLGHHNSDAGPDFLQAKLRIGDICWYGSVEIHINSSDWDRHDHQSDTKYNSVILHVVWNHDKECCREDGERLPVLQLSDRVDLQLLSKSNSLINSPLAIPCQEQFSQVRNIDKVSMLDHACVERLRRKSALLLDMLDSNVGSWEETAYQWIAQHFGFKKNAEAMLKLATRLPHKLLLKHQPEPLDVEALVFGVAGFLEGEARDQHHAELKRRYDYLAKKYNLQEQEMLRVEWDFLRMRPSNFPTVRLAQLICFVSTHAKFFDLIVHGTSGMEVCGFFDMKVSAYWQLHYDFGKTSKRVTAGIGKSSVDVLLINGVVTLLTAYGTSVGETRYLDRAVDLLQGLKPEQNSIISDWEALGMEVTSAFDTQALIELKNEFCLKKKCLSCKIGLKILSS